MTQIRSVQNFINGQYLDGPKSSRLIDVTNPANAQVIAQIPCTTKQQVQEAVQYAKNAQVKWAQQTVKTRVQCLFKLKQLMEERMDEIVELVRLEHGKNVAEGKASVMKGKWEEYVEVRGRRVL